MFFAYAHTRVFSLHTTSCTISPNHHAPPPQHPPSLSPLRAHRQSCAQRHAGGAAEDVGVGAVAGPRSRWDQGDDPTLPPAPAVHAAVAAVAAGLWQRQQHIHTLRQPPPLPTKLDAALAWARARSVVQVWVLTARRLATLSQLQAEVALSSLHEWHAPIPPLVGS
jgi:hypothetical protein